MTDHQKAKTASVTQISADDPIFAAFGVDPENAAAALHRPRRRSRWLLLAVLGIIGPLAAFIAVHWPDMAHAASVTAVTTPALTTPAATVTPVHPSATSGDGA